MPDIQNAYLPILIFFVIASGLAIILMALPFFITRLRGDAAKNSSYECGFESFNQTRSMFDVRFYLVSILFIIFDLEIILMFPWAISFKYIGLFGFLSMIVFLAVITAGFIYEWRKGALDWE